jgi:hypothetical protein
MNYGRIRSSTLLNAILSRGAHMRLAHVLRQGKEGKSDNTIDLAERAAARDRCPLAALPAPERGGWAAALERERWAAPILGSWGFLDMAI